MQDVTRGAPARLCPLWAAAQGLYGQAGPEVQQENGGDTPLC